MSGPDQMPPPPSGPNMFGAPNPPAPVTIEQSSNGMTGLNIGVGIIVFLLVLPRLVAILVTDAGVAFLLGSSIGVLFFPTIGAAVIGRGNGRRARIAFIVTGILVLLSTLAQAGAQM